MVNVFAPFFFKGQVCPQAKWAEAYAGLIGVS